MILNVEKPYIWAPGKQKCTGEKAAFLYRRKKNPGDRYSSWKNRL